MIFGYTTAVDARMRRVGDNAPYQPKGLKGRKGLKRRPFGRFLSLLSLPASSSRESGPITSWMFSTDVPPAPRVELHVTPNCGIMNT